MPKLDQAPKKPMDKFRKIYGSIEQPEKKAPAMPVTISDITSDKLSNLMTRYTAWREYTEDLLQDSLCEQLKLEEEYEIQYGSKLLLISGKNKDERQAKIFNEYPQVKKIYLSLGEAEMYHTLLQKKLESFTNCLTVISREITRRSTNGSS